MTPNRIFAAVAVLGGLVIPRLDAQQALVSHLSSGDSTEGLGWSVATLPDRDGDRRDELVAGVPFRAPGGAVIVISSVDGSVIDERSAGLGGDGYGTSMVRVPDVDGDGDDDLLVGAPQTLSGLPGYVELLSGADLSLIVRLDGVQAGSEFGAAVASLGDVDGDGQSDFAVGAPFESGASTAVGVVRVYSGAGGTPSVLRSAAGATFAERLGSALASAGDVDGDGVTDLVAGTGALGPLTTPDYARVWSGATGAELLTLPADQPGDHFGSAVAGVGDVDRDGHGDLLIGAWGVGSSDSGMARLVSGADGATLAEWFGVDVQDRLGESVAAAGDVDGDGWPDLAVALTRPGVVVPGAVRVYSGRDLSLIDEHVGPTPGDEFGRGLASAGDLDGDGRDELVVGANKGGGSANPGYVFALSHVLLSRPPLLEAPGHGPDEAFGRDVAGGVDLSGDGVPDLVVGGRTAQDGGVELGVVRGLSGVDGSLLWEVYGTIPGGQFGRGLALLGDTDGDGVSDVAVTRSGAELLILSGVDGRVLQVASSAGLPQFFTSRLEPAGDHDGDGFGDVIVGGGVVGFSNQYDVYVLSGADGSLLVTLPGRTSNNTQFGQQGLAALGDVSGDGVPDYAVGDTSYDDEPGQLGGSGTVFVFSGADGSELTVLFGTRFVDRMGRAVVAVPDQDGDGLTDVAVLAAGQANFGGVPAQVRVHAIDDGAVLSTYQVVGSKGGEGQDLVDLGDLDGDGVGDLAVALGSMSSGGYFNGRVDVLPVGGSARSFWVSGPALNEVPDGAEPTAFGIDVAAAGDLDGDGGSELFVGASLLGPDDEGAALVYVTRGLVWRGLGGGTELAGVWGTPSLTAEGELLGGDPLDVQLAGGPADADAWLIVGLSKLSLPFKGGTLVPALDLALPLSLGADGLVTLQTTWPAGLPVGVPLWMQAWIADAAAPVGFSATNALTATTP